MFVGHYGVSFAARAFRPRIPLWTLFIAVQWLDVMWAFLVLLGIERVRIVPGFTETNPLDLYYMPYTHGLVAALIWSAMAFVVYGALFKTARWAGALIVGIAVFSHWVLDFVVHAPDLPLYDDTAKVGLGLWNYPLAAFVLEAAILFRGMFLYFTAEARRYATLIVFGLAMLVIQGYVFFGPPPGSGSAAAVTALLGYVLFAGVMKLLEPSSAPLTQSA